MMLLLTAHLVWAVGSVAGVPQACTKYQALLTKTVARYLGPAAPTAAFAGQMMQESSCNAGAHSGVGAQGLTQFMPDTARWIGELDGTLAPANPNDPAWSLRAMVVYDNWLAHRNPGKTECSTYAFALSSYNGGEGWLHRDQARAVAYGFDPSVWFGAVEETPDMRRSLSAITENRGYPKRILETLQPRFTLSGWGRSVACP